MVVLAESVTQLSINMFPTLIPNMVTRSSILLWNQLGSLTCLTPSKVKILAKDLLHFASCSYPSLLHRQTCRTNLQLVSNEGAEKKVELRYRRGLIRGYYGDPFHNSLLTTRKQKSDRRSCRCAEITPVREAAPVKKQDSANIVFARKKGTKNAKALKQQAAENRTSRRGNSRARCMTWPDAEKGAQYLPRPSYVVPFCVVYYNPFPKPHN